MTIPHLDVRQQVKALLDRLDAAQEAAAPIRKQFADERRSLRTARYDAMTAEIDARFNPLFDDVATREAAALAALGGDNEDAIYDAISDLEKKAGVSFDWDYDEGGLCERCCLTGLPILEGEPVVEDAAGNKAIAAAISGWPLFDGDGDSADAEPAAIAEGEPEDASEGVAP